MNNFTKEEIIIFGIGLIEIIMLIILIYYLKKLYRNRQYYPIYQLSPIITMLQGISFYMFQLSIVINYYYNFKNPITWEVCQDYKIYNEQEQNKYNDYQKVPYYLFSILYLYSRGCCFTLTLMKSLRILKAFSNKRLKENGFITKICMHESSLIIIALFHALFFPGFTIFSNIYIEKFGFFCCLQVYENNTGLVFFNSLSEEILTLKLMQMIKYNNSNDNLINLTVKLQFYYIFWFAVNSIIYKLFVSLGTTIVGISCWIRCFYMFYNFTCIPLKEKEENPNIYITFSQVNNFKLIISKVFNKFYKNNYSLIAFQNYLAQSSRQNVAFTEVELISERKDFSEIVLFEKYLKVVELSESYQDYCFLNDEITKILELQPTSINPYDSIYSLSDDLYNHFEQLYIKYFANTYAFKQIKQLTQHNQIIQQNFKILRMPLNEWNHLDLLIQE